MATTRGVIRRPSPSQSDTSSPGHSEGVRAIDRHGDPVRGQARDRALLIEFERLVETARRDADRGDVVEDRLVELREGRPDFRRQEARCGCHTRKPANLVDQTVEAPWRPSTRSASTRSRDCFSSCARLHRDGADEERADRYPERDRSRGRGEAACAGTDVGHGEEAALGKRAATLGPKTAAAIRASTGPSRPTATIRIITTPNAAAAADSPSSDSAVTQGVPPRRRESRGRAGAAPGRSALVPRRLRRERRSAGCERLRPASQAASAAVSALIPAAMASGSGPTTRLAFAAPMPRLCRVSKSIDASSTPGAIPPVRRRARR